MPHSFAQGTDPSVRSSTTVQYVTHWSMKLEQIGCNQNKINQHKEINSLFV